MIPFRLRFSHLQSNQSLHNLRLVLVGSICDIYPTYLSYYNRYVGMFMIVNVCDNFVDTYDSILIIIMIVIIISSSSNYYNKSIDICHDCACKYRCWWR